jgi:RNA polymerase sigma-32 factor
MTSNVISANTSLPAISGDSSFFKYMQEIHKFPFLSKEEEYEYAVRYSEDGDREAAKILIQSHLRLVVKVATTFRNYGLPLVDLVSEGNMGLMRAVKKFDVKKGFRLSTYAMLWIKAYIQEYILRSWSLVKIGTTLAQKKIFFNLRKIKNRIRSITGSSELLPNHITQIASDLNVKESEILEMNQRFNKDTSLNQMLGDENDGIEMQDTLESNEPSQEKIAIISQEGSRKRDAIEMAIKSLNEREQEIIKSRYFVEKKTSLEKLSKIYKVSKERVRQIEEAALKKMKKVIGEKYVA